MKIRGLEERVSALRKEADKQIIFSESKLSDKIEKMVEKVYEKLGHDDINLISFNVNKL